jgi:hypothetical protein
MAGRDRESASGTRWLRAATRLMRRLVPLLVGIACRTSAPPTAPSAPKQVVRPSTASDAKKSPHALLPDRGPFRLPHTFEPVAYRLRVVLERNQPRFTGAIEIEADLAEPLSLVWLDSADLEISEAHATRDGQVVSLDVAYATARIGLSAKAPLERGRWTIALAYSGIVREREPKVPSRWGPDLVDPTAYGLFHRAVGSDAFWFTNSEPIEARRIFPCVDEPDRKVPWQLTLDVPAGDEALANSPVARDYALDSRHRRFEFAVTPPLPSYLIAFAVGPLTMADGGTTRNGTRVRMAMAHGNPVVMKLIASTAVRIIDLFDAWFEIPYPYAKLDLVAVPGLAIAMENPGLITLEETWLDQAHLVVQVLSHEIAHQWFGDLVTPKWWNDLWLSESFAAWMAAKVSLDPDRIVIHDASDTRLPYEPRALRVEVDDSRALSTGHFGDLIDEVGDRVVDAIERYVGPERFRRAIHEYLVAHANGTGTSEDLFAAIASTAGPDVAATLGGMLVGKRPVAQMKLVCADRRAWIETHVEPDALPVSICYAYDRGGKRADGCTTVSHEARIPLTTGSCPRWFVPDVGGTSLAYVERPDVTQAALASLNDVELRVMLVHATDDASRLNVERVMLERGDAKSMNAAAARLLMDRVLAPTDLRAALDAWILAKVAARAGHASFGSVPERISLDELLAIAGEPGRRREALSLVSGTLQWATAADVAAFRVAFQDPSLRVRLLQEASSWPRSAQFEMTMAVATLPDAIDLLKDHLKDIMGISAMAVTQVVRWGCDPARRDEQVELIRKALGSHDDRWIKTKMDECIKRRAAVEPTFRSWVGATRKAP